MMGRNLGVLAALVIIIAVPFLLRPANSLLREADHTLVIISPHNEAIRYEFARAFGEYYQAKHGETVRIDWRTPGGTSEIARFITSEFQAAFEYHWTRNLKKPWNMQVLASFDNRRVVPAERPEDDTPEQAARRAFLDSEVGAGLDLFFGGGSYDFQMQAAAGRLVDSGVLQQHPEWFGDGAIPRELGGEIYWDAGGLWVGTCLSAFGICHSLDAAERLGLHPEKARHTPEKSGPFQFAGFSHWNDLGYPKLAGQVALADPTKSGSVAKAFEMLLQQQIREVIETREAAAGRHLDETETAAAVAAGWEEGLRLILRISANARYFTDAASKIPLDVSIGDAAAGMVIDFYGRFQSEAVHDPVSGTTRMLYETPSGGSSIGVDPIGLFRGAPSPEVAREFIYFVLSEEGQKLWNYKVGTPGGPVKFALRRLPVQPGLYDPATVEFRSDPDVLPYALARDFTYVEEWTAPLFRVISFMVKVACLDPHEEMKEAWHALIRADFPPEALARFLDVSQVDYAAATGPVLAALRSPDKLEQVRLAKELGDHFRQQYVEAGRLAGEGKQLP